MSVLAAVDLVSGSDGVVPVFSQALASDTRTSSVKVHCHLFLFILYYPSNEKDRAILAQNLNLVGIQTFGLIE